MANFKKIQGVLPLIFDKGNLSPLQRTIMQYLVDGKIPTDIAQIIYGTRERKNLNRVTRNLAHIRDKLDAVTTYQAVWKFKELVDNERKSGK